jgi:hypothetical protein
MKKYKTFWAMAATVALLGSTSMLVGCQTEARTGALIGAVGGAALGAGLDHNNRGRGALIGAGAGGAGGYMIGNESDKEKSGNY